MEGAMRHRDASIVVSPGKGSLDDLARVLAGAAVMLDPSFWPRVEAASSIVAKAAPAGAPLLRVNTRIGKLAWHRIRAHGAVLLRPFFLCRLGGGGGPPPPEPIVRLMMALKIVSLGRGASGVRR